MMFESRQIFRKMSVLLISISIAGDSGLTEYEIRTASKTKQIAGTRSAKPYQSSRRASLGEKFRIYFPSEETVARSIGGKRVSPSLSCHGRNMLSRSFLSFLSSVGKQRIDTAFSGLKKKDVRSPCQKQHVAMFAFFLTLSRSLFFFFSFFFLLLH